MYAVLVTFFCVFQQQAWMIYLFCNYIYIFANHANTTRLYTLTDVSFASFYFHSISILVLRFYAEFYEELST